ncbi:hypothetical protein ACWJJH_06085 [Endozoicomonadaceae bacterium StTr2]
MHYRALTGPLFIVAGILCLILLLLIAFSELQRYYTRLADEFYQQDTISEERLLVMHDQHYLLQSAELTPNWHQLLNDTTGPYQNHHYIGWDAELEEIPTRGTPTINLYYEVRYLSAATYEILSFRGLFPPRLILRQVRLGHQQEADDQGGAQKMDNALVQN